MKLSICIPTYNRSDSLIKQIKFILMDCVLCKACSNIEIIIADNNSTIEHYNKAVQEVEKLKKSNQKISLQYVYNNENVGLVRNLKILSNLAQGEYIWFVGDDDIIHKGIVGKVLPLLNEGKGLVFINHRAVDRDGNVLMQNAFSIEKHKSLYEIFNYSKTTMMFITACVYKKNLVDEVFTNENSRLSLPFYLSFYCFEKNGMSLIDNIMIDNYWGDTSWSNEAWAVFHKQVPKDIIKIISETNERKKAIKSFYPYLIKVCMSIIRHHTMKCIRRLLSKNEK